MKGVNHKWVLPIYGCRYIMIEINENQKDRILGHLRDTLLHKSYVITACLKMFDYLVSNDNVELGILLLQRANIHDNSKLIGPELELLSNIYGNQDAFIDPMIQLSEREREVIETHWENNCHHPEHFDDIKDMSDLDILEMVCDWYARSMQFKTDFLEFVKTRQETRFHFPEDMFKRILEYCEILNK